MFFFTHNIGEFSQKTRFLSPEEVGVFVLLRDQYLTTEQPLQCGWIALALHPHCKNSVERVLGLFFRETEAGWVCDEFDAMIEEYRSQSDKKRQNAQKRWNKAKNDASAMQTDASALQLHQSAMLTNNQEPITNNQEIKKNNKKKTASLVKPDDVSQEVFDEWIDFKKSVSRAKPSQRMIDAIVREAQAAEITTEKAMVLQMENGWQGFKAEYVKKESGNLFGQQSNEVTAKTITDNQVRLFASTLANYGPMSKFSRSGESYKQFEMRLATNLRIPERFEEYKPYLVKVGLLEN